MRKTIDQLWRESWEDDDAITHQDLASFEVLLHDSGEQVRGGDRPCVPIIYESRTYRNRFSATIFLEKIGL